MFTPQISWLHSFTVWPAPLSPTWVMVVPMPAKKRCALAKAAASPPAMMDSDAFFAPSGPPDTGASTKATPTRASSACMRRTAPGAMVLMSITSLPSGGFASKPPSPWTTASTSGVSGSMVMTASAPRLASAMLAAARMPCAASSCAAPGRTS
jgi:hypothetical protein